MPKFIPTDEHKAQLLDEKLSGTLFKSAGDFINFYNSGIISKKHNDVAKLVKEVTSTYKNVKEHNGKLLFISPEEIQVEEALVALQMWESLVRVKRELKDLIASEDVREDSIVYFLTANVGIHHDDAEGNVEKLTSEKAFSRESDLKNAYKKYSTVKTDTQDDTKFTFKVSDITNLDESFVSNVYNTIPR